MFRAYNSIELASRERAVLAVLGIDSEWVVTEKAHGANFSFAVGTAEVTACKRTSIVPPSEYGSFYNCGEVVNRYKDAIVSACDAIKPCIVYGELIGGLYRGVLSRSESRLIQKGVQYCPNNEFYVYDVFQCDTAQYLPHDTVLELFTGTPLVRVAPVLFRGELNECLAWSKEHLEDDSIVPGLYGLPIGPQGSNSREGHVLKPASFGGFLGNGSRPILKDKGTRFSESRPQINTALPTDVTDMERFVTLQRLEGLQGKVGPDCPFGKLLGLYVADAVEDWCKETDRTLNKKELQAAKRYLSNVARPFLLSKS